MEADDDKHQSSFIKQSNPKLIIKFAGRNIIQQQCSSSKEAEEVKNNMSVSKHNLSISNISPKSISNNSDSSLLYPTCSICGKSFRSKQSLFGHMRSHPEREWRGIQPPSSSQSQSLSVRLLIKNSPASTTGSDDSRKSVESDSSYQGVGPLAVQWSGTGKRGRRSYYDPFVSSDERIPDAIKGLLMLKEGNDLDVALMNKQISRETEGITLLEKKNKKKRMILESSSSEDVSTSSDLLRSSKKIKIIDQEKSCSSTSRDGFDPKLMISNIQSQSSLPAASNMFQEDCGLLKEEYSKKVKKLVEHCGFDTKLMNGIQSSPSNLEQLSGFHGDIRLVKNSPKKVKLDERGCGSSRDQFDIPKLINSIPSSSHVEQMMPTSQHLEQMYSNGFHGRGCSLLMKNSQLDERRSTCSALRDAGFGFDSKLINSIPSSSYVEQPPNGYFQGMFNSVFLKPAILMKATVPNKKKVKEIEKGSSDMEFKCDTCHRTFPSHQALGGHKSSQRNCKSSNSINQFPIHHDHQDQYLQCRETMFQAAEQEYITKTPTTSYVGGGSGTHTCELCGSTFGTGQALGGHKRRHYTGAVPFNSTTAMAQTEKLIKKEEMNRLSVVPVGEEVISTTTTKRTENKQPVVLEFDLNEMPDESW